jgi:hypothetical protein
MTLALSLLLASVPSQASELLSAAVAQPRVELSKQISTKGRLLADGYEFADEFRLDTLARRKTSATSLDTLISLGSEAVPYLVSQLSSKEPTNLKIGETADVVSVKYEFYDPKARQADTEAWSVVTNEFIMKAPQYKHTVTRGDVAFFALGQITNRWYGILGGNPALNLFCSSSDHPEVQKSAKDDWEKLTSEELKALLRQDVLRPDSYARQVFGFARYRTYFPNDAADLAIDCLRTSYGKWAKGEPSAEPRSFILELQPIASPVLDEECQRILMRTDKENGYLSEYELTKYEVILYLRSRPNYMPVCLNYAQEVVKKKSDKYGYFKRFLENYGKKKTIG